MLKSKIHRATITATKLDYEGSISIDEELLKKASINVHEQVDVVNVNNGSRFVTYAIPAKQGSGDIVINGAAARLAMQGDLVIIITYCGVDESECENHKPRIVMVDSHNRIANQMQ